MSKAITNYWMRWKQWSACFIGCQGLYVFLPYCLSACLRPMHATRGCHLLLIYLFKFQSSMNVSGSSSKSSRMIFLNKPFGKSWLLWTGIVVTLPSECLNLWCEPITRTTINPMASRNFISAFPEITGSCGMDNRIKSSRFWLAPAFPWNRQNGSSQRLFLSLLRCICQSLP